VNRLPAEISRVERVTLGQLPEDFAHVLGAQLETWTPVQAPARRRQWHYDGAGTLAVHVASTSDIDDVIPTLVAYQIEWNKLHRRVCAEAALRGLIEASLRRALQTWFWPTLQRIAQHEKDFAVRLLGGTHVGYAKLTRRRLAASSAALAAEGLVDRPTYFVSSNLHSLVNLVSGYAPRRAADLWSFLEQSGETDPNGEAAALSQLRGQANTENVLYYAARLWHQAHPESVAKDERAAEERERGILAHAARTGGARACGARADHASHRRAAADDTAHDSLPRGQPVHQAGCRLSNGDGAPGPPPRLARIEVRTQNSEHLMSEV
jgi:hypothetical protein